MQQMYSLGEGRTPMVMSTATLQQQQQSSKTTRSTSALRQPPLPPSLLRSDLPLLIDYPMVSRPVICSVLGIQYSIPI